MDPAKEVVWVKYGTGRSVGVNVPSDCNVNDLIDAIKGKLAPKLDAIAVDDIDLCKPERDHEEGGEHKEGGATAYRPSKLVSAILAESVVSDVNPILIRTTQQGI